MNELRRFVMGDIHGCYDKLENLLKMIQFDSKDILYGVGDCCDRGGENLKTLNLLTSLPEFKGVFGNHDIWAYLFLKSKIEKSHLPRDVYNIWMFNGGEATLRELENLPEEEMIRLRDWFGNLKFQINLKNFRITHSASINDLNKNFESFNLKELLEGNYIDKVYDDYIWDRSLDLNVFLRKNKNSSSLDYYEKILSKDVWTIYGHTPHLNDSPSCNKEFKLINLDCGSYFVNRKELWGFPKEGQISILNLDTFEWFKSNGEKGKFEK